MRIPDVDYMRLHRIGSAGDPRLRLRGRAQLSSALDELTRTRRRR